MPDTVDAPAHPPSDAFAARAHVDAGRHREMYRASVEDPDAFWGEHGRRLDWIRPYEAVSNCSFAHGAVSIRWFEDGTLNVAANCVDRHLASRGEQTAIIFEPDDPDSVEGGGAQHITYQQLHAHVGKFGKFTVPEFIGDRFHSTSARVVAVVCLPVVAITYVIGQMTGAGVAFSRFLEVSNSTGLFIASGVVFVYAVLGDMKGITYTQVAQYCVLIVAYTIPAVFISLPLTGNPIPGLGLFPTHAETGEPLLATLDQIVTDLGFTQYTAGTSHLNMTLFTLSLMIGTAGLPHVIIRFFTAPRVADARWSAG